MKIGILTLTLHTNYGGILQAYALQTVLERMGHEVVVFNRPFTPLKTKWWQIPKRIVKKLLGRDVVIFSERKYNREAPILNQYVWEFRKKYIHERIVDKLTDIKEGEVDCIVVGSDQVWRPRYFKEQWQTGIEDAFLAFTKGWNIKRIAYAVSFGVDTWEYTPEETEKCREAIKMFDAISVREDSGVKLLRDHLKVSATHLLDPTLLLKKEDYISLFENNSTPKSDGDLLVYFFNPNKEKRSYTSRIAQERKMEPFIVNISHTMSNAPLKEKVLPPVESWIRGFHDAKFVITDSFHACVFSIIFQIPFVVFLTDTRGNSRILSLLKPFKMEDHIIEGEHFIGSTEAKVITEDVNYSAPELVASELSAMVNNSLNSIKSLIE